MIPTLLRYDFRCDLRPAGCDNSGKNGGGGDSMMPTPKDAEEYYCLRQPDPDETGSSLRSSPDVGAQKGNGECSATRVARFCSVA